MGKLQEAEKFLQQVGMPKRQQSKICALSLLALAGVTEDMPWFQATGRWTRIHDIIAFSNEHYGVTYAENSRETFRKQALHHFRTAALIEDNGEATNSPNYRYRLTTEALTVIRNWKTKNMDISMRCFLDNHPQLVDIYASKRRMAMIPVKINSADFHFSSGKHNALQKAVIEEFSPRFAPGAECLYVGDTLEKDLVKNTQALNMLGIEITVHDKMPDIILYSKDKNWIYFVEAVTSVGPIDSKRLLEINLMSQKVTAGKIFVTAFPDFGMYKRFSGSIAWNTEVWIAEAPEHLIHLNGDRFLGPRKPWTDEIGEVTRMSLPEQAKSKGEH